MFSPANPANHYNYVSEHTGTRTLEFCSWEHKLQEQA